MGRRASLTGLDQPWHRRGAVRYALRRLPGLLRPLVEVYEPATGSLEVPRDLPVATRDRAGMLHGAEAVVDKDLTAALLACAIAADVLLLTDVDAA